MSDEGEFSVPAAGIEAITKEVLSFGRQNLETGGFLLTVRGEATISAVALTGTSGIVRRPNLFQISALALERLFTYAADRDLWIPIQFHSHGIGAFLSETDEAYGLRVEGFVSVVVPHFAEPPIDMSSWGWWKFTDGEWLGVTAAQQVPGGVNVIHFDEEGVDEG